MDHKFLLNETPSKLWRKRMIEFGDELFTEERLELCDKALISFINKLEKVDPNTGDRDEEIMKCVEEVVIAFNELNDENDFFIETMEREELAEIIDKAARAAGLEVEDEFDITEEWREW